MPIVIGLGDAEWSDPLNIYGGKPSTTASAAQRLPQPDVNRRDLVNTIIAEAAGEGDQGMTAVAQVIKNRADRRGKDPAEIVREPDQFTGYSAPGPEAIKAMEDPAVRARAESILDAVLAGKTPDITGGADHYHAGSVSPSWAQEMPKTARVGDHLFYRAQTGPDTKKRVPSYDELAGAPGLEPVDPFAAVMRGEMRQPKGKGLGDLLPERNEPTDTKPGALAFVNPGQDKIAPQFRSVLEGASADLGRGLTVLSGFRGADHSVEAAKRTPGEHSHGTASDISMKGMNDAERQQLVQSLLARGAKRFITYTNSPDMLHVDMKDQAGDGRPWFMHDKTNRLLDKAPAWFQEIAANPPAVARQGQAATPAKGEGIVVGEDFKASDPMGLMRNGNPFDALAQQQRQTREAGKEKAATQFEDSRNAALIDQHNREVEQQAAKLSADAPGRYAQIDEAQLPEWQKQWDAENRSSGLMGDVKRIVAEKGVISLGQSLSSLADTLFNNIPGGKKFIEASDAIDRWAMGKTLDERMAESAAKADATVTQRQQDADAKNWWDEENWTLGPAWRDPRSYLRVVGESVPSTVITMAPGGILARGAYMRAVAAGASERAAAAVAARTATVSGAIAEGLLGGADTARSVRERIAALPRDQVLQSSAVQDLIKGGMSEDEAISALSEDAATQSFLIGGVATGMFGGLGDRALAKILAEGVGGSVAKRILTGTLRGAVAEGVLEEAPQGAAQKIAENIGVRQANPDQELTQGVGEAVASGIAGGGVMGGAMGGVGGAASRRSETFDTTEANDAPRYMRTDGGGDVGSVPPAPAVATPPAPATAPAGPISRAVQNAAANMEPPAPAAEVPQNATETAPNMPAQPAAASGRPEVGATVRIDADGIEPFMGRIDGYEGEDAVVIDSGSGEVYQIPIGNLTKIADSPERRVATMAADAEALPTGDVLPSQSSDPALEPAPPIATERTTSAPAPSTEDIEANMRFPGAPEPGQRIIVNDETVGRFPATVERWEGTEAVVRNDQGKELQVPLDSLKVNKLTPKQVEERDLKVNPPADRAEEIQAAKATGNTRTVFKRTIVMPDELHGRLFDLGVDRAISKRTMGASQLDLGNVNNPELQALAKELKVSPQAVESMADDYRYRVQRAARSARSDMPQRVAPIDERRLKQWQSEFAKQTPESAAQQASTEMWWDAELTAPQRKDILARAGVKRSENAMWGGFTPAIRKKIEMVRDEDAAAAAPVTDETAVAADTEPQIADTEAAKTDSIDVAANEAATSPTNDLPEPTQAQKEAGNYKVGRISLGGMDISIENPAGSERSGVDTDGETWSVKMQSHYGYIRGTVGRDKDHIDVFVKPGTEALTDDAPVFVVDQENRDGSFDEHKVMLGFETLADAKKAYSANYSKGWKVGPVTQTTLGKFKAWAKDGDTSKRFSGKDKGSTANPKPSVSKNSIFTADAAEAARALLKRKLNQINSGIDPEILQAGITLAGYHIERGARTFAAYASAMIDDLGEVARPYLKSWYMGVKYDPRAAAFDGMSSAADVDAIDVNTIATETPDGSEQLEGTGAQPLEGVPAGAVPGTEGGGETGASAGSRSAADVPRGQPARRERAVQRRSVADDAGAVSPAAADTETGADDVTDGAGPRRRAQRPTDNAGEVAGPSSVDALTNVDSAAVPAQQMPADFTITEADAIGQGGAKTKFKNNVEAIRILRNLDEEKRPATRDEQAALAKWVGWGGLRDAFARQDGSVSKGWEKQAAELKALLTDEEYRAAEASTRNAHYTSPEVVDAVWSVARRLGFKGGKVLEPSVGSGNFLGLMPADFRDAARVNGVELDHITGGIAKNLYPGADIAAPMGFEKFTTPNDYFDLAIGNPPFGSEKLYDKQRRHLNKLSIHNFFFAKSVEALRPGGVLAMVVTNRFLDTGNPAARQMIAKSSDLIGAIRLPNNAFLKNAGTEVTTDIIVLRKRMPGEAPQSTDWTEVGNYTGKDGKSVPLNRYFIANPDMMLGDFGAYGTMYGPDDPALVAREGQNLSADLAAAVEKLPQNIMVEPGTPVAQIETVADGVEDVNVGSVFMADGEIRQRLPDSLGRPQSKKVDLPNEKAVARVEGMIRIRDAFARLRRAQIDAAATDQQIENLRKRLNTVYDAFVAKHGPINLDSNKRLFRDDPTWPQISALENDFDKGISVAVAKTTGETAREPSAKKAPIFTKRTQQPYQRPTSAATAKDALAQTLNDLGRVDMPAMVELYGKPETEIVNELGPLLYRMPGGGYEAADAYLSGNVKQKLAEAERAAQDDPDFRRNVVALRDVIPADIEAVDIDVKPGAPWIPGGHIADFIEHITQGKGARAMYSRANGAWSLDIPRSASAADVQWGTDRASVGQILSAALNGKTHQVYDRTSDGNAVINQAATDAANEKVARVKAEWNRWIWDDDARRDELARLYNDTFNTDVIRPYDGSHLTLPGKVSDDVIDLRPHQKSFVWRTLQSSVALADHTVGAGKTFALIASIMEKRRTGQARKPMLTVPNHLVGQWAADFTKLYPGAKVLAPTKQDFEKENRKRLFARVATGDWDVVIVAHSQYGLIGVSPELEERFIRGQIDDLESSIREMEAVDGKKSKNVAQLAKRRQNLEAKLQTLLDAGRKDEGLYFDDLGVDAIYVDEFHEFKNLGFITGMQRVAGLGNPSGSKRATDMYIKIQSVIEKTGGNIVVATGTPLSNTMAEMYTLMRYLAAKSLDRLGIQHFDAWARVFGDVVTDWELSASGQYKLNSRFARFVNMPELMKQYLSFADVVSNDDIKSQLAAQGKTLPLPKVKGGKPLNLTVERSRDQAAFIGEGRVGDDGALHFPQGSLVYRAENLPKKVEKGADNMLKVMSDARKAALDMRLISPDYADNPESKVSRAADEMMRIYDQWTEKRGTQLVFIDLSTPKKHKAKAMAELQDLVRRADEGDEAAQEALDKMSPDEILSLESNFSVYDDLRDKLIARGVPADEIAFIHDANTDLQKETLFGKVRSGRVRFLFGSTPKMGAGTNVQNRLVGLHHLDAPWRPSDLEQREGRIIRQGNELYAADPEGFEVEILRYATKNTLDAMQWERIENKARFIAQVRKGDSKARQVEDIAGEASNAAEMKAAASGNPLILEEMETRRKLRALEGQATEHQREQHRIKGKIRDANDEMAAIEQRRPQVEEDAAAAAELIKQPFEAVVRGEKVEKPKEFGTAMLAAMRQAQQDGIEQMNVGSFGPFRLAVAHQYQNRYDISIKAARTYNVIVPDITDQDPTGLAVRVINTVKNLPSLPAADAARAADLAKQVPALEKQIGPWKLADELADVTARHAVLLDALKPKPKGPAQQPVPSEVMQPKLDKRPDPAISVDKEFKTIIAPPRASDQSLMDWATNAVLDKGHADGTEYLMAIDDDGSMIEFGSSGSEVNTGLSSVLAGAMANPDRRLVVFHNHPKNSPLSLVDIAHLAAPGLYSLWAIGHGGKNTRAQLTDAAKAALHQPEGGVAAYQRAQERLYNALKEAEAGLQTLLQQRVRERVISSDQALLNHRESIPLIAARAGLIDYISNEPYDPSQVSGLDRVIDNAALTLARKVFNERRPKTIDHAGVHRPTERVRHVAELGTVAGRGSDMVRSQSGPSGLREGSSGDYLPKAPGRISEQLIKREVNGRLTDLQPALLKALPLNYFPDLARPNMTAVADYMRVKRLMDAYRGKKHAAADEVAGQWLKYARLGMLGKDKTKAREMSDLMHDATLAGVDPSKTDEETKALPGYQDLRKRYLALSPSGRQLFAEVRDAYRAQAAELDQILLDNVRKAQQIALDRAEERYKRTLQQIRDTKMDPIAKRKAEEDAASAYKAESTKQGWAAKARMTKLRIAFESNRVAEPYFPLGRFGRYFVTVRDTDGSVMSFSKFERAADRDRFAADAERAYPAAKIEKGVMEQGSDLRRAMDPRMVAEIEEILGGAGVDSSVMDMIYQRYLETMPDLSTRKRFIHRKGTAGYANDALRVFSSHMFHAAHQMARLKYGLELQDLANKTTEQAKESDDQTKGMTLANELAKRHEWILNPTGGKVAQIMTSAAFIWFLALSPSAAVLNMTQTVMLGLPILGARFGGIAKAGAALARASADTVRGKGSVRRANLTPLEQNAIEMFYDSGLIDRTQSHDLAGVGETGIEYTPVRARAMAFVSAAFHYAEVWNREVTALAAYRLARDAGQDHLAAIDTAHNLTWSTHFDYSNSSRPALMQNDVAKVALVFRQHNINMLYRVGRDIHQSLKGETAQARKEARYQLAGVVGMMSLMAGVTGTIGFNLMMAVLGLALGDDDDPLDFTEQFKADTISILGPELGGIVLNGVPGHYLGVDLSSRIGMPDLWFRSPTRELQGKDEYQYWLSQTLGATAGLGEQVVRGVSLIMDGNIARGVETVTPKAVRDLMKAYRYYDEGLTSIDGSSIMSAEQIGVQGVLAQALGFTPAGVAETWDRNTALKNAERRILDERQRAINKWAMAAMAGDKEEAKDALAGIAEFNRKKLHQSVPIKRETLERSIKTRMRNEQKREDGALIANEILGQRLRDALPDRIYD